MKDITGLFSDLYIPFKALLIYAHQADNDYYIECHDIDPSGKATNVHPLSVSEADKLATVLGASKKKDDDFLHPDGMLPDNLLFIDQKPDGQAIWYTPSKTVNLYFSSSLGIPDGQAGVPPLLWKASKTELSVWALAFNERPTLNSKVYSAPFFNCYPDGKVCLGNVAIKIPEDCSVNEFMGLWENYFFASKFSHLLYEQSPVKGNIVQLWQKLMNTGKPFPVNSLIKTNQTLKNVLP